MHDKVAANLSRILVLVNQSVATDPIKQVFIFTTKRTLNISHNKTCL
jgi:hypothetical protein